MITLSASGGSVTFEFSGNSTYLNDGTIEVPKNSLALIIDESDMITFRKSASNDIFVSANIAEFGMTKDELMAWYKANMVGSTGGGGGVTSGEVQTMIDESISGKADTSYVDQSVSGKANSSDVYTTGQTSGATEIANALNAKLDATAYTPTVVDAALSQSSTNPVQNKALYDELRLVTPPSEVELVFENGYATNLPNNCSAIKITVTEDEKWGQLVLNDEIVSVSYWNNTLTVGGYTGETYDISGNTATIYLPSSFELNSVEKTSAGDPAFINVAAITPSVITPLINAVSGKVDTDTYSAYTANTTPKVDAAWQEGIKSPSLYYDYTSGITLSSLPISGGNYNYSSIATDASIGVNNGVLGVYTTGATHAVTKNDSVISNRININSIPSNIKMYWNLSYTGNTSHYIAASCLVNDGTNGYCQWDWENGQYVPNNRYVNTAVTLSYDSTNQVVTITPSSSSALTSIIYVRCNRNIAPSSALTQDNCKIGLVTIDTNSYKLQEALDNKQDTLIAGRGISITTGETADTVSFNLPISASTGENSIAEGYQTSATSIYSHAEGYQTLSSSWASHAEGSGSIASGDSSHAEGQLTVASGSHSHAEGDQTIASGSSSHAEGSATVASEDYSHAEGGSTSATSLFSHAEGYSTIAKNRVEHASGQYNVSNKAHYAFGNSGNTLFSVGNGTADDARHNAFEIRQNGDIYITKDGSDVKLQDQLGSSIEVSSAITKGDTNPVEGGVLYDELRIENAPVETTLTFTQPVGETDYWTTNYPSGCTTLVGNILASSTQIELYNNSSDLGGFMINCYDGVLDSVTFWRIEGTYSISGSVVTISYPNTTNVTRFRIRESEYQPDYQTYKAMTTVAPTVLKNQVNDNTTALGGLKLQQISQSDYDNLPTKDASTLYVII